MTVNSVCRLQIGLLGPFYLLINQQEVQQSDWKSKKALTMLKYLASRHGQRVSSDALIELLWPDNDGVDSTSNLHTAVWYARRHLTTAAGSNAESPLRYSNGTYWLDLGGGCVDLDLFDSHVIKSQDLEESNPEMALFHCEAALQLYRGDLLCEEPYEDWTIASRAQYRELFFQVALRAAKLLMSHRKDYAEATALSRKALEKDPFREEFYQVGIQGLIQNNRYLEAMNLYNNYRELLYGEFGLEPSPAIQEVIAQIKQGRNSINNLPHTPTHFVQGAYIIGRSELQTLFETEKRRLRRTGSNFAIIIINTTETQEQGLSTKMFSILQRTLRHSDLICQFSPTTVVLFLPDTDAAGSRALLNRIRILLKQKLEDSTSLAYDILNSEGLAKMQQVMTTALAGH